MVLEEQAFDTVNHDILLHKLEHYGTRRTSFGWFTSYLNGRSQYVSCNNTTFEIKPIVCGVPQGSVLGLSLKTLAHSKKQSIMNLKKLVMWLNANSPAKTNFVVFSAVNKPLKTVTILINRLAIEQKEFIKYLGVLIDSKLTFKQHISAVSKNNIFNVQSKKILVMLYYYSLIYPFCFMQFLSGVMPISP